MFELKIENNNNELLNLTNNNNYSVYKIEGLQPPVVTVNTSKKSTSDGSTVNNASVEKRNIVIYLTINGDVETNRINLYKYFPLKQTVKVYFKNNTRDVYIEGLVEVIECDLFSNKQIAQISLICPQPYFEAVDNLVTYFSEVSNLFKFPFSISKSGIEFSVITTDIRRSIVNVGDVETGIIIKINANGTVVNPVIHDVRKRTHIALNCTLEANDEVIINTNVGEKSITLLRSGVTSNILGCRTPDSKWLTVAQGDNVFTFSSDTGNSNLQIQFTTSALYGGV